MSSNSQAHRTAVWIGALLACGCLANEAGAQTFLDRITVAGPTTQLQLPVAVVAPPDDTSRVFVLELHVGRVRVLDLASRTLLPTPVLTITDLPNPIFSEQGLLGLAFDPDFANNGYFYLNYTASNNDTHIERYRIQGDPLTSNVADPNSKFTIMTIEQPGQAHNAGWMAFGPNDGYLYIATGDGGGGHDTGPGHTPDIGNAQDVTNLLGKILRIDVSGDDFPADNSRNYAIPSTNPFVGQTGADEIWSYGLRNPWRASFDRETGDLWIGDVGQASREEINYQPASSSGGENYGWRLREGDIATPTGGVGGPEPENYVPPVYDYPHSSPDPDYQGGAVTGGYVYRGAIAEFVGHYIFADHTNGNIWKLDPDAVDRRASVINIESRLVPNAGSLGLISSLGEDADGELYFTQLFAPSQIFRVATTSQNAIWQGGANTSWDTAANWTRGGAATTLPVAGDNIILAPTASQLTLQLGQERDVAAVTFTSSITLQGGALRVRSGNVTVASGVTATIASDLLAESANQSIRKLGAGTLLVEGSVGQTSVKQGTLGGNGILDHLTVRSGGTVAPGTSAGTLNVENTFNIEQGAILAIDIGGTERGVQFDYIAVGDVASLGGQLSVSLINGFQPSIGQEFEFLTATGGIDGAFSTVALPALSSDRAWRVTYGPTSVTLSTTLAGDFSANGVVENADLTLLLNNWGTAVPPDPAGWIGGPLTAPAIDNDELTALLNNWGNSSSTGDNAEATVPEPTAILLACLGALMLYLRAGAIGVRRKNRGIFAKTAHVSYTTTN